MQLSIGPFCLLSVCIIRYDVSWGTARVARPSCAICSQLIIQEMTQDNNKRHFLMLKSKTIRSQRNGLTGTDEEGKHRVGTI